MLTGPQMLLKSMGIDPEKILSDVKEFGGVLVAMQQGIARIEANQKIIMDKLDIPVLPDKPAPNGATLETVK